MLLLLITICTITSIYLLYNLWNTLYYIYANKHGVAEAVNCVLFSQISRTNNFLNIKMIPMTVNIINIFLHSFILQFLSPKTLIPNWNTIISELGCISVQHEGNKLPMFQPLCSCPHLLCLKYYHSTLVKMSALCLLQWHGSTPIITVFKMTMAM